MESSGEIDGESEARSMENRNNFILPRCGCRWVPSEAGRSLLLRKCASGSVAVEGNGREDLVGRTGRLSRGRGKARPVQGSRTLCTVGALDVGVTLPRVDGRM